MIDKWFEEDKAGWAGNPFFHFFGTETFFREGLAPSNADGHGTYDIFASMYAMQKGLGSASWSQTISFWLSDQNPFNTYNRDFIINNNSVGAAATQAAMGNLSENMNSWMSTNYYEDWSGMFNTFYNPTSTNNVLFPSAAKMFVGKLNADDTIDLTNTPASARLIVRGGDHDDQVILKFPSAQAIADGGKGIDSLSILQYPLGVTVESKNSINGNEAIRITSQIPASSLYAYNFEKLTLTEFKDNVTLDLSQVPHLKELNTGGGNDNVKITGPGSLIIDGKEGKDTVDFSEIGKKLTIDLEGVTAASYETDGLAIEFPVELASLASPSSPGPIDTLKSVETLILGNLADKVVVDRDSLKINLKIDMAESNRQASPFNLDVYDLSNVGEGLTYRSGKVAFGWGGPLSTFIGLTENLQVKNADKIILTPFDDTVVSADFGNVIHTGAGADTIWLGSDGVAIDDLSKDDRLTIAGVLPLFGGIRNAKSDSPWGHSYGGAVSWAEDVSGALQVNVFGMATTYILNWGSSGGMNTPFAERPGHISLFNFDYLGVFRLAAGDLPSNASQMGWWDLFGALVKVYFGLEVWKGVDPLTLDLDGDGLELTGPSVALGELRLQRRRLCGAHRLGAAGRRHPGARSQQQRQDRQRHRDVRRRDLGLCRSSPRSTAIRTARSMRPTTGSRISTATARSTRTTPSRALQVWRDLNEDGVTEAGELFSLADARHRVDLGRRHPQENVFVAGNQITATGTFTRTNGSTGTIARRAVQGRQQPTRNMPATRSPSRRMRPRCPTTRVTARWCRCARR